MKRDPNRQRTANVGLRRAGASATASTSCQARLTRPTSAAVTGKIDVRGLVAEADLLDALAETRADLACGRFDAESADAHMDRVEVELDGGA